MPKYYCDYCDTYLTHDSPSVRKTHNGGRKHKENVRIYYTKWMEDQAQSLIDQTTAQMKLNQPPSHSQVLIHQPVNVMPVMVARGPPGMGMMGGPMLRPGQVPLRGPIGPPRGSPYGRPQMQMGMRVRGPMPPGMIPGGMMPHNGL